ncbi:hypothetical protein IA54_006165 [Xanthomonas phaseoli pv. syngonii LMG 9055]|uniref:Uncharacterized protein n=1 Tax=Xanthomonas phaseoli pv. syngonii LMG 9055 TaxID=1437878 RepID=A0A1V9H7N2_9XANT|nr:hypothetical protein IA54_006165 [Xanthomonas phaseoli pv. syngonii LMG 9055]
MLECFTNFIVVKLYQAPKRRHFRAEGLELRILKLLGLTSFELKESDDKAQRSAFFLEPGTHLIQWDNQPALFIPEDNFIYDANVATQLAWVGYLDGLLGFAINGFFEGNRSVRLTDSVGKVAQRILSDLQKYLCRSGSSH